MITKGLTSRAKGQIAILKVQLRANHKDLLVSVPIDQELYYDLILDGYKSKKIIRAQVKYCNRKNGNNLELNLGNKKSKRIYYSKSDIDWILCYLPQKDVILKFEQCHFHRKKTITINLNNPKSEWYFEKFIW